MWVEAFEWYMLFYVKGIGPKTFHRIYQAFRNNTAPFTLDAILKTKLLNRSQRIHLMHTLESREQLRRRFQDLTRSGIEVLHLGNQRYPKKLLSILADSAPPIVFCKGDLSLLEAPTVAIVGSREASKRALEVAHRFAYELGSKGVTVVSGYAKGIDTKAHLGALAAKGATILVLSEGISQFKWKKEFKDKIGGGKFLIISQFPENQRWTPRNAMTRNKLTCALSDIVIVIEAKDNSGTLNTGLTALKLNIPLFVVSPTNLKSKAAGSEKLLKLGAHEITANASTIKIVLQELNKHYNMRSEYLTLFDYN